MLSVLIDNSVTKIINTEPPTCGENEVIVNMKMCGLCGTDIEKINGNYKASGITLGHEPVGIIHKKGKNVIDFNIGERVFVHHHVPCYNCHHCLNNSETMCNQYRKTNIEPGGFSEFFKVPQINIINNGILKLQMAGSCSGCAMSQQTLRQGVESMMRHYVPEVMAIESEDDSTAKEQGYTPWAV